MAQAKKSDTDLQALDRRLQFEGDARYLMNRLLFKAKWSGTLLRLIVKLSVLVFDLIEFARNQGRAPSIGEPSRVIIHTQGQLRQHPRFRGYWYDPDRHAAVGMQIGVDMIRHAGRFYINEVNLDAAMRPERRELYATDIDPVFSGICRAAQAQRFGRVVLCGGRWRESYREEAGRAAEQFGLDVSLASIRPQQHEGVMSLPGLPAPLAEDTLYVVFSGRHTPLDYLVHDKFASATWLSALADLRGAEDGLVSGIAASVELFVPDTDPSDPWPNLVVKLAGMDRGRFVLFGKFRDERDARNKLGLRRDGGLPDALGQSAWEKLQTRILRLGPVLYQAYVRPNLNAARRIQTYRMHMLVSPVVNSFLSVHAIESAKPAPDHLPFGIVTDAAPYITSFSLGARYRVVDEETSAKIQSASKRIGAALHSALTVKFATGPGDNPSR